MSAGMMSFQVSGFHFLIYLQDSLRGVPVWPGDQGEAGGGQPHGVGGGQGGVHQGWEVHPQTEAGRVRVQVFEKISTGMHFRE